MGAEISGIREVPSGGLLGLGWAPMLLQSAYVFTDGESHPGPQPCSKPIISVGSDQLSRHIHLVIFPSREKTAIKKAIQTRILYHLNTSVERELERTAFAGCGGARL